MRTFALLLLIGSFACTSRQAPPDIPPKKFIIKHHNVDIGTYLKQVVFYKNRYYCLTGLNRLICLNDQFRPDSEITSQINQKPIDFIEISNDTLMAVKYIRDTINEYFFLDTLYRWKYLAPYRYWRIAPDGSYEKGTLDLVFEDERFWVTTCCVGEFGGSLFFKDKKTKLSYSCPATCAVAINKISGCYYVTSTLAHMGGFAEILKIKDPAKLWRINDSLLNHCNWWTISKETDTHEEWKEKKKN